MPKKVRESKKILIQAGFKQVLGKGSHTNDNITIPVKRHNLFDRITANQICKQAGLDKRF